MLASRVLLALVALIGTCHALDLSSCGLPNADCTVLNVNALLLSVNGAAPVNISSPSFTTNCTGGGSKLVPTTQVCDAKSQNLTVKQATLTCNIAQQSSKTTSVVMTFVFQGAACGPATVSLTNLSLGGILNLTTFATTALPVPTGSFQAAINTSFSCPTTNFAFSSGANLTLTMSGLQAQALAWNATLAPADANAVCSASPGEDTTSTQSRAGLIVGGIISALALLGILAFAYSKCRTKSNYELVNNSH